jgi:type II secretory pathway component GspD/PulD (secretin)
VGVMAALCALGLIFSAPQVGAQTNTAAPQTGEARSTRPPETTQTIFLKNVTQQNDLNDIATALRNALPWAKTFPTPWQNAITIVATEADFATAQRLIADLDKPRKLYRLTYTITDFDAGRRTGSAHDVLLVVAGMKTNFKQGSRVPIVIGTAYNQTSAQSSQIQYEDVGLSIEATVTGTPEDLMLFTRVEQSSLAGEKSATTAADPVIQQTSVSGTVELAESKPAVLGSLDIPGTARHQEIEVVAELVH